MYISQMRHFLNEKGEIPTDMNEDAKQMAGFLAMVVDATTITQPSTLTTSDIRCIKKACHGMIKTSLDKEAIRIHWFCPLCESEGIVSNYENTKWDNSK
jgi:hypothetical protein